VPGQVFYDLSIDEMRDADDLINRILLFGGHPNVQKLGAITVGETAEEMLRLALESEKAAVAQFNASAKECHHLGDHGAGSVFEEMVRDEEKRADWFEGQVDAVQRIGMPQYLAQQVDAGAGPE
jgi:bacterioferritin